MRRGQRRSHTFIPPLLDLPPPALPFPQPHQDRSLMMTMFDHNDVNTNSAGGILLPHTTEDDLDQFNRAMLTGDFSAMPPSRSPSAVVAPAAAAAAATSSSSAAAPTAATMMPTLPNPTHFINNTLEQITAPAHSAAFATMPDIASIVREVLRETTENHQSFLKTHQEQNQRFQTDLVASLVKQLAGAPPEAPLPPRAPPSKKRAAAPAPAPGSICPPKQPQLQPQPLQEEEEEEQKETQPAAPAPEEQPAAKKPKKAKKELTPAELVAKAAKQAEKKKRAAAAAAAAAATQPADMSTGFD